MSEHTEQSQVIRHVRDPYFCKIFDGADTIYHPANGGRRSKRAAGSIKTLGVLPGVWDLHCPKPAHGYHGLWIEMKDEDGNLTDDQEWWGQRMSAWGHRVEVCRSAREAISVIEEYLG